MRRAFLVSSAAIIVLACGAATYGCDDLVFPIVLERVIESIGVSGHVVDDATGKPVSNFSIQGGHVDEKDPARITWGVRVLVIVVKIRIHGVAVNGPRLVDDASKSRRLNGMVSADILWNCRDIPYGKFPMPGRSLQKRYPQDARRLRY